MYGGCHLSPLYLLLVSTLCQGNMMCSERDDDGDDDDDDDDD